MPNSVSAGKSRFFSEVLESTPENTANSLKKKFWRSAFASCSLSAGLKFAASESPWNKEQHQQRSRPGEQLQLYNETHDLWCVEGTVVGLAADTHILFSPFGSHLLWHSPNVFLHEWTSHPIRIRVTYAYDSLRWHSCTYVHNMTLTDTIDTNCHRSYSFYCNEYLFDTAASKQRVYMHKLKSNWAYLHQITKLTKDKSHSCQRSVYLHTICNQIAHL